MIPTFVYWNKKQFRYVFQENKPDWDFPTQLYSRTAAFGGISPALRRRGAFGTTFGRLQRPFRQPPPPAAVKDRIWGGLGAPNGFKNVTRSTRIPNMCLVLKLDNGKKVSIANGQNHRRT